MNFVHLESAQDYSGLILASGRLIIPGMIKVTEAGLDLDLLEKAPESAKIYHQISEKFSSEAI